MSSFEPVAQGPHSDPAELPAPLAAALGEAGLLIWAEASRGAEERAKALQARFEDERAADAQRLAAMETDCEGMAAEIVALRSGSETLAEELAQSRAATEAAERRAAEAEGESQALGARLEELERVAAVLRAERDEAQAEAEAARAETVAVRQASQEAALREAEARTELRDRFEALLGPKVPARKVSLPRPTL